MKQSNKAARTGRNCITKPTVRHSRARVAQAGSGPTMVVTISGQTHSRAALVQKSLIHFFNLVTPKKSSSKTHWYINEL